MWAAKAACRTAASSATPWLFSPSFAPLLRLITGVKFWADAEGLAQAQIESELSRAVAEIERNNGLAGKGRSIKSAEVSLDYAGA